jgi:hypothetical protein
MRTILATVVAASACLFTAPLAAANQTGSLDYDRGIDVIRWKGQHYIPRRTARASSPSAAACAGRTACRSCRR